MTKATDSVRTVELNTADTSVLTLDDAGYENGLSLFLSCRLSHSSASSRSYRIGKPYRPVSHASASKRDEQTTVEWFMHDAHSGSALENNQAACIVATVDTYLVPESPVVLVPVRRNTPPLVQRYLNVFLRYAGTGIIGTTAHFQE